MVPRFCAILQKCRALKLFFAQRKAYPSDAGNIHQSMMIQATGLLYL